MTEIKNIQDCYFHIRDKEVVRKAISDICGVSESSVSSNYLSKGWIPPRFVEPILNILQKQLRIESK